MSRDDPHYPEPFRRQLPDDDEPGDSRSRESGADDAAGSGRPEGVGGSPTARTTAIALGIVVAVLLVGGIVWITIALTAGAPDSNTAPVPPTSPSTETSASPDAGTAPAETPADAIACATEALGVTLETANVRADVDPDGGANDDPDADTNAATNAAPDARQTLLEFSNRGAVACTLEGYPLVSLVESEAGSQLGASAVPDAENADAPTPVTLAVGGQAQATLTIADAASVAECDPVSAGGLRVTTPTSLESLFVSTSDVTACSNERVALLQVGPIVSVER